MTVRNMIDKKPTLVYWNYFLALEKDVEILSRYIEFDPNNFDSYSIELAHLFLAASSEIDVVLKELCKLIEPRKQRKNIDDYRKIIKSSLSVLSEDKVKINRFGLTLHPWENWITDENPSWWKSYNNVKHERNNYFNEANLKNTLNAMAGLYLCVFYYYKMVFSIEKNIKFNYKQTHANLSPRATLFYIDRQILYAHIN